MHHIKRHSPEKLFVSGEDCIVVPVQFKPHTVVVKFIDAEAIKLPGCNPVSNDTVCACIIRLPEDDTRGKPLFGIQICWKATGTREIEWLVTELSF